MMSKFTSTDTPTMKKLVRPLARILLLSTTILGSAAIPNQIAPATAQTAEGQFYCGSTYHQQLKRRVPTTIVSVPTGKSALVQWVKPMGNHWTPERRCVEFSNRLEKAYRAETLRYLTNGKSGGQKVICTATEVNGKCQDVLMTLRPKDDALKILYELKDTLNGRAVGPLQHSSGEPQIYLDIDWNAVIKNAPKAD
jgi:Circadian oscillating protein COP23